MEIHMFLLLDGKWTRTTVVPDTVQEQMDYMELVKTCMRQQRKQAIRSARKEFKRREKRRNSSDEENTAHFRCCICQEEHMTKLCALQCGHVMHEGCVSSCDHCPLCKEKITTRTRLYI